MSIAILIQDPETLNYFDLEDNKIDFQKFALGDTKKVKVRIVNQDENRPLKNAVANTVPHPTQQTGTAEDTYDACYLALDEAGPWFKPINLGTIYHATPKDLWLAWYIAPDALPGYGIFALHVTGEYEL